MGLYRRVFCTKGSLTQQGGSPLVPSPVSHKGAPLYQLNTISLNLSQGEVYALQYPAFPGCHLSERRVTGLGLASCYLLRGRLRPLCSLPGSCISLGSPGGTASVRSHFLSPTFLFRFPPAPHHPLSCTVWFMVWLLKSADQWLDDTLIVHFTRLEGVEIPKLTQNLWTITSLGRGTKNKLLELLAHS